MLARYSLAEIVRGQARVVAGDESNVRRAVHLMVFFVLPIVSPVIQGYLGLKLNEEIISIIVSAASIFAGLLLNLLVIVYGLAPDPTVATDDKTLQDLSKTIQDAFYNISYSIVVCGALVAVSLVFLTNVKLVMTLSAPLVYYLGFNLLLAIIQVLKRCHSLMEYRLTPRGKKRSIDASTAWPTKR